MPSKAIEEIEWGIAEGHIAASFDAFRETYSEALREKYGTGPRSREEMNAVIRGVNEFFEVIREGADAAILPRSGGRDLL